MRLTVRSATVISAKRKLVSEVRARSRTPATSTIRTRDFLAWGIPGYRLIYESLQSEKAPATWQFHTNLSYHCHGMLAATHFSVLVIKRARHGHENPHQYCDRAPAAVSRTRFVCQLQQSPEEACRKQKAAIADGGALLYARYYGAERIDRVGSQTILKPYAQTPWWWRV